MRRAALIFAAVAAVALVVCSAASADTIVPAGQTVVEATVIGENLTLNGTSTGSVIVIDGNLTLGPNARAEHGITIIGGHVSTAPGAVVQGDIFQVGAALPHPSSRQLAGALVVLLLARLVVVWLIWRIALILGRSDGAQRMFDQAREHLIRAILVGALITAGLSAAAALSALTVVAAPFALAVIGVLLGCAALGCAFALQLSAVSGADHRLMISVLAVPVIGDAALALATIVGSGALFHHLVEHRAPHPRGANP